MPQLQRESKRLKALQDSRAETTARMSAMLDEAGDKDLNKEQGEEYARLEAELKSLETRIEREEKFLEAQSKGAKVIKSLPGDGSGEDEDDLAKAARLAREARAKKHASVGRIHENSQDDPNYGFRTPRDFLMSVMGAGMIAGSGMPVDPRLRPLAAADIEAKWFEQWGRHIGATAGSDEQQSQAEQYGGYLVPESFLPDFLKIDPEDDPLANTMKIPMASPIVNIPSRVDKNHTTSVAGGIVVGRKMETNTAISSLMSMEKIQMQAYALFGLSYASEEILVDSPISFAALLDQGFRDQFTYHMVDEKLNGTGVGQYLGIMNSPCLVTIAEDSGPQAANTITIKNVLNMRARCWGYNKAVWIANHDCLPQIATLALAVGSGPGAILVFMPSSREDVPDLLLGRPIHFTEYTQTLGTKGDIILANMSQYLEGNYQPLQRDESVHVRFLQHERTFKFWMRNAGAPWWKTALTPKNSSNTLSPFVALATRNGS